MENQKIKAYLDYELTRELESFVINALPQESRQSDFNVLYMANLDIEERDGVRYQNRLECDDTFFLSVLNDFGQLDYELIKTIHVADILSSELEVMEYYPSIDNMPLFSNYYEGNEIQSSGFLQVAISPFGITKLEMLNGDIVNTFGTGKISISPEQRGLKGYAEIPKVTSVMGNDYLKILKLAIYTRYTSFIGRKYTVSFFSPTMRFEEEALESQMPISDDRIKFYNDATVADGSVVNKKDGSSFPAVVSNGNNSVLHGIGKMMRIDRIGLIDLSTLSLEDEFSVHLNLSISKLSSRGTILFEMRYLYHFITLWVNSDGIICYNTKNNNEYTNTGIPVKMSFEHTITFTIENQRYDEEDDDEYVAFIHLDGKQVWPKENMLMPTEKIYIWRAMEAYRTYTEVCMLLPAMNPINGGLDAKDICAKKLLHESGFVTMSNLKDIYELYLDRPKADENDLGDVVFSDMDSFMVGQDSQGDTIDSLYYFDGEISEILVCSPGLNREEIEQIHLLNTIKVPSVE